MKNWKEVFCICIEKHNQFVKSVKALLNKVGKRVLINRCMINLWECQYRHNNSQIKRVRQS